LLERFDMLRTVLIQSLFKVNRSAANKEGPKHSLGPLSETDY
jgi:hypothetical protein